MMVVDGRIRMTDKEWLEFQRLNWAPWRPRTPEEFNAMCELAMARHRAENTAGMGEIYAVATKAMKFGPKGEINFPEDKRRTDFIKVHGYSPNKQDLEAFEKSLTRDLRTIYSFVDGESPTPSLDKAKLTAEPKDQDTKSEPPADSEPPAKTPKAAKKAPKPKD
jgi:hypothetical protein